MSVVIVPGLLVFVAGVLRSDPLQGGGHVVVHEAGFVLESGEGRRGPLNHERSLTDLDTDLGDGCLELSREVDDVVVSSRAATERAMFGSHA